MALIAVLHENDNVATALTHIEKGTELTFETAKGSFKVTTTEKIPLGHKVALEAISTKANVIKYGEIIGIAKDEINVGDLVHIHNIESIRGRGDLAKEDK